MLVTKKCKLYPVIENKASIIMKVEAIEIYPKNFKDSIKDITKETIKATNKNTFLEWHKLSTLCEQKAKSRKSIENKVPPMNVAIQHIYNIIKISYYPGFPHISLPSVSKLDPLNLESSAISSKSTKLI